VQRKEILQKLLLYKQKHKNKYDITKIGIFGSASRDCMNEKSDIDIVVELVKPDLFCLIGIKQDLEEYFNCPVDIIRLRDQMNPFLKDRIEKEAVYV
jgi:predicted nucleotidyltransferase